MKKHLGHSLIASLAILLVGLCCTNASAQSTIYLEDFTTNQTPLFDFGAFAGNTSFSAAGLLTDIPASADSFGGIGVAPVVPISLAGLTSIELTAQVEPGNMSDIVVSIREAAVGAQAMGEFFSFTVPATSFTPGAGFQTVSIDPTTGFNGDVANGILDGPLDNSGIQSPFGGTAAQSFTVQSIEFIGGPAVPEPGSLAVLLSLGSIVALRRRRI